MSNYEQFGSAEVARVAVRSPAELAAAGRAFFSDYIPLGKHWARPDYYDVGRPYRAVIGVPGGAANAAALAVLRRPDVNTHGLALVAGRGGDADTTESQRDMLDLTMTNAWSATTTTASTHTRHRGTTDELSEI